MPEIVVLPHAEICPEGMTFDGVAGKSLLDNLLDRAWGLTPLSRLSCQAIVDERRLVIEIPRYTINQVKEGR